MRFGNGRSWRVFEILAIGLQSGRCGKQQGAGADDECRSERMEQVLSTIVNNGLKAGWTALGHKEGEGPVREGQVLKILAESGGQLPEVSAE